MHELSITQGILQIALDRAAGARRITDLYLVVGQLSSIIDDSVQFYWEIVSSGTVADKSQLHFRRVPAVMKCTHCGKQYSLDSDHFACPDCDSSEVRLISGDEFYLDAIEVENELIGQGK